MKAQLFERVCTLENIRGHYLMILPVINVFPKKETFRDDYVSVHIGWIWWLFHIKLWTKKNAH